MYLEDGRIKGQTELGNRQFLTEIYCPKIAEAAKPGQFVHIACGSDASTDPLLRRPLSIHKINREEGSIEIYYLVIGKGTDMLSKKNLEQSVSLMGPLGKGFEILSETKNAILVGGGMGIAPLLALAEELNTEKKDVTAVLGAASINGLVRASIFNQYGRVLEITEDGTSTRKGLVTDYLLGCIKENAVIYACGPQAMLKAVAKIATQQGIPCQVSLEAKMACGVGACLGCTCVASTENGYPKVCKDGPVFWAEEVVF